MVRTTWSTVVLTILVVIAALLASCGSESADASSVAVPRSAEPTEKPGPAPFIVSTSGTVERLDDGVWESAGVGEVLGAGTRIRTGRESTCQVQFATVGLVHLGPNSEFEAKSTVLTDSEALFDLRLIRGTAAASVRTLRTGRSFRVSTDKAVARVRGTEFLVERRADGGILVAVEKGMVEVLPSTLDLERITAGDSSAEMAELLTTIRRSAVFVESNEEVEYTAEELDRAGESFRGLQQQIDDYLEGRGAGSLLGEIRDMAEDAVESVRPVDKVAPLSGEAYEKLKPIRDVKMIPVEFGQDSNEPELDELVRVSIRTIPESAEILVEGELVGKTTFSSLYRGTEELNIIVRKEGYAERVVEIPDSGTVNEILAVQLKKLPPTVTSDEFLQAVERENLAIVREYIMTGGDVNVRNDADLPALAIALDFADYYFSEDDTYSYNMELVNVLLDAGADPNVEFLFAGEVVTPFFMALATSLADRTVDLVLVDSLLSAGADVDKLVVTEDMEVTPLAMTVIVGIENQDVNIDLVQMLLEAGGNPHRTIEYDGRRMSVLEASSVLAQRHGYEPDTLVRLLRS